MQNLQYSANAALCAAVFLAAPGDSPRAHMTRCGMALSVHDGETNPELIIETGRQYAENLDPRPAPQPRTTGKKGRKAAAQAQA